MNTALITIGFFIIAIAGFFVGRWHGMSHRSKELSDQLEQKEEELSDLRSNVNEHFSETGRLFTNLTEEYKSLYQHLSKGASELSDESFHLSLAAPAADTLSNDTIIDQMNNAALKDSETKADDITDVLDSPKESVEEPIQPVDYAQAANDDEEDFASADSDHETEHETHNNSVDSNDDVNDEDKEGENTDASELDSNKSVS